MWPANNRHEEGRTGGPGIKSMIVAALVLFIALGRSVYAEDQVAKLNELAERYIAGDPPATTEIDIKQYRKLKTEYPQQLYEKRKPEHSQQENQSAHDLVLDSFDESSAWVAVVTQSRSEKVWHWEKRYKLRRDAETDNELGIPQILKTRQEVIADVKYGMTVAEVIEKKGRHYKVNGHQLAGSAHLVYDDVTVDVRNWWTDAKGRVVHVEATTDRMKKNLDLPYADEGPLVGKLGKPVGTELTIEGTFQARKNSWILVSEVNGEKLSPAVLMATSNSGDPFSGIPPNTVCRFKGKEITYVVQNIIDPKTGLPGQQPAGGRHFDFKVTEVLSPKGVKIPDEK